MRLAFVSFADGTYVPIQKKLIESIQKYHPEFPIFAFHSFQEIHSPTHADQPYAFKPNAIESVRDRGYDIVIWCDSPMRLIRRIDDWIPEIETRGVYIQEDGWTCGQWANNKTLDFFGVSRDEAMTIPNASAGIVAFDFRKDVANKCLQLWKTCSDHGLFRGNWTNKDQTESKDPRCLGHRHDQTCLELIGYKHGIQKGPLVWGYKDTQPHRYFTSWDHP